MIAAQVSVSRAGQRFLAGWLKTQQWQDRKMKDQKRTKDVNAGPENAGPIMQG